MNSYLFCVCFYRKIGLVDYKNWLLALKIAAIYSTVPLNTSKVWNTAYRASVWNWIHNCSWNCTVYKNIFKYVFRYRRRSYTCKYICKVWSFGRFSSLDRLYIIDKYQLSQNDHYFIIIILLINNDVKKKSSKHRNVQMFSHVEMVKGVLLGFLRSCLSKVIP
jgi:hypothetical protein